MLIEAAHRRPHNKQKRTREKTTTRKREYAVRANPRGIYVRKRLLRTAEEINEGSSRPHSSSLHR